MRRLGGMDAFMLYSEVLPTVPFHTLKIAMIGPNQQGIPVTASGVRSMLELALERLPPFRWTLHDTKDLHRPLWLENQQVDLDRHVISHQLPEGAGRREVCAVIGGITGAPLSRDVPLWEIHVLEGLADGTVVAVGKVHHALADGSAAALMLRKALDPTAEETIVCGGPRPRPDGIPSLAECTRLGLVDHVTQARRLPSLMARTVRGLWRLRKDQAPPRQSRPFRIPSISLNGVVSAGRGFGVEEIPMELVLEIRAALGMTVNDVLCTIVAGALREVLIARGDSVARPLLASIPTKADPGVERDTGNFFGTLLVDLPVEQPDAIVRALRVREGTTHAKRRGLLLGQSLVAEWSEFFPPRLTALASERRTRSEAGGRRPMFNLVVSSVAGPRDRLHANGHPLTGLWSVGPVYDGAGVNITAWSYAGSLAVAVHVCSAMVPDTEELTTAIRSSFEELLLRTRAGVPA